MRVSRTRHQQSDEFPLFSHFEMKGFSTPCVCGEKIIFLPREFEKFDNDIIIQKLLCGAEEKLQSKQSCR